MKTKLSPALQLEAMLRGETPRQRTSEKIIALNERIKRLEEQLMDAKNKHAVLVADVVLNEDRAERIKRLEDSYAAKDAQLSNLLHICRDNDIEVSSYDLIHGKEAKL